jgi:acyl-coenzyme A thioesterase PaaI-like protein
VARPGAGHPRLPAPVSLQTQYSPTSTCFGCGPANGDGLRIESERVDGERPGELRAVWQPLPHHAAFGNILNGGIIGTLLDCHANWTAAMHLMHERGRAGPPGCVTADYAVRLRRPTPVDRPLELRAWPVEMRGDQVVVEAEIVVDGIITATCRGTFVAVGPDHPAYARW